MKKDDVSVIVLTGGPCSGKTTALGFLPEKLESQGCSVMVVPEVATLLISGGISPKALMQISRDCYIDFEEILLKLQFDLEKRFRRALIAKDGGRKVLILDRGAIDVFAYLEPDEVKKILSRNRLKLGEIIDRYNLVVHLVTAADGAEQFYTRDNNPARYETPDEARAADKRTQAAWNAHPHLKIIDNSTLFEAKLKRLLGVVQNTLGLPKTLEIERKFLVDNGKQVAIRDAWPVPIEVALIEQVYLESVGDKGRDRIRKRVHRGHATFFRTFKIPSSDPRVREEREERISEREYQRLMRDERDHSRSIIRKRRICFSWQNQRFELDVFLAPEYARKEGLVLLEIELTEVNSVVTIPPWLGKVTEVTDNPDFKNSNIAKKRQ